MIAVDTNILIYAHREEFPQHERAITRVRALAEGAAPWGVPVFCIGEFVRVTTHRKILKPPSTLKQASAFVDALFSSESFRLLLPDEQFWPELRQRLSAGRVSGNLAFDAQIAAVCLRHGTVLLTEDRDFASLGVPTAAL